MRTALTHYRPWSLLGEFQRELDERLSHSNDASVVAGDWAPAVDVREEKEHYLIRADLPGVKPEDIEITLENGMLTVRGQRASETTTEESGWQRRERLSGNFYRRFSLPDSADAEQVSAKCDNGVLEVTIPKHARVKPRTIRVSQAA
ncbi:MAG: Hsp20/alpha crystallin family protein [Gammaproteobacteria bacterium]